MVLLILLFSLFANAEPAKTVRIAVIDTGFGYSEESRHDSDVLCDDFHKDFSGDDLFVRHPRIKVGIPADVNSHGTNVAGVIAENARRTGKHFCLVILKIYNRYQNNDTATASREAIKHALKNKIHIINYSGGGIIPDTEENLAVKEYLDAGGTLIAAAGNENSDLAVRKYYPAQSDNRVIVVGNLTLDGKRAPRSNYGLRVNKWEIGQAVRGYGIFMSGTSQACAVHTGKYLGTYKEVMIKDKKNKKAVAIRK